MGRPKKFTTVPAAAVAKKESDRQRYLRRCQQTSRPEFIAYEPQIAVDYPIATPANVGLRISADIPIPEDLTGLLYDEPHNETITHRAFAPIPTDDDDAEISEDIRLAQANEKEWDKEQAEYEAAIAHQIEERMAQTAKGMMEIQSGGVGTDTTEDAAAAAGESGGVSTDTTADTAAAGELEAGTLLGEGDLPADLADSDNSESRRSPTFATLEATVATTEAVPALRQPRLTSSSHSSVVSSRNKSLFPAQTNNLLGWLQPVATRPSAPCVPLQPVEQRSPNTVLTDPPTRLSADSTARNSTLSSGTVSRGGSLTLELRESTAVKLAKQLRNFQGCTHEEHNKADQQH